MCSAARVRGLTPHGLNLAQYPLGTGGAYSPFPSLGKTIPSAFDQLLRGPGRPEPLTHSDYKLLRGPLGLAFLPLLFHSWLTLRPFLRIISPNNYCKASTLLHGKPHTQGSSRTILPTITLNPESLVQTHLLPPCSIP